MLELFNSISLNKDSKNPLYIQLYDTLKQMIEDKSLLPDYRLPSIRRLSSLLNVNQVTVVSAYKMLERDGYAYSKSGSGTFTANIIPLANNSISSNNSVILDELYYQEDISLINNSQIKIHENTINFASATPTTDLFPVEDFKLVLNEVLDQDKGNAFGYQDSQGFYPLRECISGMLQRSSIKCTAENIQVISGAQQGIDIISKALLNQGDCVITESPTYTGAIAVFKSRGAQVIDITMEEDGPNLNVLEYNLKKFKPKLIYTIPSFQNPTGYSYSNYKRKEIVKLATKYNSYIIEDDYISDLDFEGKNFIPLKAMDDTSRIIFIKSFSKIFMPGLRLGFMIVPLSLQANILQAKHTTDISTSGLLQRALNLYMRKNLWEKHFDFMFKIYKERYIKVINSLDSFLNSSVKYSRPGGGLNIWLTLPYSISSSSLLKHSAASDIVFAPGKIFYSGNCSQMLNSFRLSFAAVYTEQVELGIEKLCGIIEAMLNRQDEYKNLPLL